MAAERSAQVRRPAVAGRFYPAAPDRLADVVDRLLAAAVSAAGEAGGKEPASTPGRGPRALVVPHAGYRYSGAVAARGYAELDPSTRRVAVLGPAHFVPLRGVAACSARAWETPLGVVPVEVPPGVTVCDPAHASEHALEVQLPFLQRRVGPDLRILPLVVGDATAAEVADALARLDDDVLVLVSTDLSHYLDEAAARRRDRRTAEAILALDWSAIRSGDACGAAALRGLLELARRRNWGVRELLTATSADAGAGSSRVVGYGAFALGPSRSPPAGQPSR